MKSKEVKKKDKEEEEPVDIPDSLSDPEVVELTPPQDHQPSLTNSKIETENKIVSPKGFESEITQSC